ncbi:MAG: hypothetical protein IT276_00060 [Ignavibacteriaceae bacterium]|nr:hypothetical protein [Ignavibacterium sp.]MCC6253287.1 hypothetical protein [Ignavibacteriaceae bacterium]HRN26951.1 hypothetical protein [Ignavibacteriaceae bacterium]HRQ54624.1 hypothetical protein [Ignavibacteriaceae bacterium]
MAGIISCSEKKEKIPILDFENKAQLLEIVRKHYNKDTQIVLGGMFDETGKKFEAAGTEINNNDEWGIKFTFLEQSGNEFIPKYETDLLDGSFKGSLVDKIKFSSIDYDLVYYNSQGYFLGSGGGEIFSYIIDFENKQVYYAHLVVESSTETSLFISDNTQNKELVNFFTLTFKKDYPSLKIVKDDVVAE